MSSHCCSNAAPPVDAAFRRVLWIALVVNAAMFLTEMAAGLASGSVSLLADAIDFFGDSANYALSLVVLGMAPQVRSRAAIFKAACMALFGAYVLARALWGLRAGEPPHAVTMGVVALLALLANVAVALMMYRHRGGDANTRSAWVCSRNDALGNVAVGLAALGVLGTGSALPDLIVAAAMAVLALTGAAAVFRQARGELRATPVHAG